MGITQAYLASTHWLASSSTTRCSGPNGREPTRSILVATQSTGGPNPAVRRTVASQPTNSRLARRLNPHHDLVILVYTLRRPVANHTKGVVAIAVLMSRQPCSSAARRPAILPRIQADLGLERSEDFAEDRRSVRVRSSSGLFRRRTVSKRSVASRRCVRIVVSISCRCTATMASRKPAIQRIRATTDPCSTRMPISRPGNASTRVACPGSKLACPSPTTGVVTKTGSFVSVTTANESAVY